jgi:putative ABC transport system permease protein
MSASPHRGSRSINGIWVDLLFSVRRVIRTPGVLLLSTISLGLGIGFNAGIFSAVRGLILQAVPFPSPERMYFAFTLDQEGNQGGFSRVEAERLAADVSAFDAVAVFQTRMYEVEERGAVQGAAVSPGFFSLLGRAPRLGSLAGVTEGCALVLSDEYWRQAFGEDPSVVGRTLRVSGKACSVAAVMPPALSFPRRTRLWTFLPPDGLPAEPILSVLGRLRQGTSSPVAREQVARITSDLLRQRASTGREMTGSIQSLSDAALGRRRAAIFLLRAAAAIVFLIACFNVCGLLLARQLSRSAEFGVRVALGAGAGHVWRLLFCEALVLVLVGGVAGTLVGVRTLDFINALATTTRTTIIQSLSSIIVPAGVLSVLAVLLVVLPTGLRVVRGLPAATLGAQSSRVSTTNRLGVWMVGAQVGLAVTLLVPTLGLVRSLRSLEEVDPGFVTADGFVVRMSLPDGQYAPEDIPPIFSAVVAGLREVPGVSEAGLVHVLPLTGWNPGAEFRLEGTDTEVMAASKVDAQRVSSGYFAAMGIPLLQGKPLADSDSKASSFGVALVNDAFRRRYLPSEQALGRRLQLRLDGVDSDWLNIVGVVGDVPQFGLDAEPRPEVYVPSWTRSMSVVVRARQGMPDMATTLRGVVPRLHATLVAAEVRSLEDVVAESLLTRKAIAVMMGLLGGVAIALGGVGLFGIASWTVERRMREIGIRRALGADWTAVTRSLGRDFLGPIVGASAFGLFLGTGVLRALRKMLYQVQPFDLHVIVPVVGALIVFVVFATLIPLLRALRTDPARVLRVE